jgi:TonB family protein
MRCSESEGDDWKADDTAREDWMRCIDAGDAQRAVDLARGQRFRPAAIDGEPVAWSIDRIVRVPRPNLEPGVAPSGPLIAGVGDVTNPRLIPKSKVDPRFPESAAGKGIGATVILQAVISRDGTVGEIEVLHSDAPPGYDFEMAAMEAVSQWRYEPALSNGEPVDVYFTVIVDFTFSRK